MSSQNVNLDYCGIVNLIRHLLQNGACTEQEAQKIASRIATISGADIVLFF